MSPLAMFGLGVPELLIILAVVLLLFGGSRLAGLGKSTGRALKEFKEETKGLKAGEGEAPGTPGANAYETPGGSTVAPPQSGTPYQSPQGGNSFQGPQTGTPYQSPQGGTPYQQPPQDGSGTSGYDVRRDA